jgi:hypothetical protein
MRWVALVLVASTTAAYADQTRADEKFEEGKKALAAKEYAKACLAFEASFYEDPAIGTQLNIGRCYDQWGKAAAAYQAYLKAETMAIEANDSRASVARKELDRLVALVARVRVDIVGDRPDATFKLDGESIPRKELVLVIALEPGSHVMDVDVPGGAGRKVVFLGQAGKETIVRLEIPLAPPPKEAPPPPSTTPIVEEKPNQQDAGFTRSAPRLYGGLALGIAGVAALGIGTLVALDARSDYEAASAMCPDPSCDDRSVVQAANDARDRAQNMTFVFIAGGAAIVGGAYLVLTSKRSVREPRVTAAPVVTARTVGFTLGATW